MSPMDAKPPVANWRKASHSIGNGACVEVAAGSARVLVRDSVDPAGPAVHYASAAWQCFIASAKLGQFDSFR
jgi:Domain of unknown function (DUF397)